MLLCVVPPPHSPGLSKCPSPTLPWSAEMSLSHTPLVCQNVPHPHSPGLSKCPSSTLPGLSKCPSPTLPWSVKSVTPPLPWSVKRSLPHTPLANTYKLQLMSGCLPLVVQIDPVLQCLPLLSCGVPARLHSSCVVMAWSLHAGLGHLDTVHQFRKGVTTVLQTGNK